MRVILATSLALALTGCEGASAGPDVSVEGARITLPASRSRPGAGYFTLRADAQPLRITAISSPRVQRIELHETSMKGGVIRMRPLQDAIVPANGELEFAPGGKHAMLFGVDPALKPGDQIELAFSFDRAPAVTVNGEVQGPGGGGHGAH
jgi:periplasmic copper chaperone A